MAVTGYEFMTVLGDYITADLIVWRRYKIFAPGILERLLDDNPHLAKIHKVTPWLPVGTQIRIPIDLELLNRQPRPKKVITLYGKI